MKVCTKCRRRHGKPHGEKCSKISGSGSERDMFSPPPNQGDFSIHGQALGDDSEYPPMPSATIATGPGCSPFRPIMDKVLHSTANSSSPTRVVTVPLTCVSPYKTVSFDTADSDPDLREMLQADAFDMTEVEADAPDEPDRRRRSTRTRKPRIGAAEEGYASGYLGECEDPPSQKRRSRKDRPAAVLVSDISSIKTPRSRARSTSRPRKTAQVYSPPPPSRAEQIPQDTHPSAQFHLPQNCPPPPQCPPPPHTPVYAWPVNKNMYPAPCATISAAHAQHQSPRADSNLEAKLDSLTSSIHAVNQRLADMESHHHPHGPRSVLPHSSPQQRESIIQRHLREADLTDEHGSTARAEVPAVTSTSGNSTSPPTKVISGKFKTFHDTGIINNIVWPHHVIHKGPERKPVKYDDITIPEFVLGVLRMAQSSDNKIEITNHLMNVLEDMCLFEWEQVRQAYGILLSEIEHDRCQWDDAQQIDHIRRLFAQHPDGRIRQFHFKPTRSQRSSQSQNTSNTASQHPGRPCMLYQNGRCGQQGDHVTKGHLFRHVCNHCWTVRNMTCIHQESRCIAKTYRSGPGGPQHSTAPPNTSVN